jgi:rfaE bifunctional protein kinase chain/domain
MLDKYIWGSVDRISPEAPVPVVKVEKTDYHAGGAANVAENIHGLGGEVTLIGLIGDDPYGETLHSMLKKDHRYSFQSLIEANHQTTVKTRVMVQGQQVVRMDDEITDHPSSEITDALKVSITKSLTAVDGIILQDYEKGIFSKEMIQWIMIEANQNSIPVYVDPKETNYSAYSGARLFKPNLSEFYKNVDSSSAFDSAAKSLRSDNQYEILLVTLGSNGMTLFYDKEKKKIPTQARSVHDVSGAGDTVIATFVLCDLCGVEPSDSAWLANIAAGRVCEEVGVVPVNTNTLIEIVNHHLD